LHVSNHRLIPDFILFIVIRREPMRALQISAYGNPSEVLSIAEIPETGAPGAGEVLIEIELAPLNKHDLLFMRAISVAPSLPRSWATRATATSPLSAKMSRTSKWAIEFWRQT